MMAFHMACHAVIPDNVRQWSIGDGLSQSEVRSINRDSYGMMWFGTADGLNRFDGYEFRKYVKNPFDETSLSNDQINVTFEDDRGSLWVGTNRGLNRFVFKKGRVERIVTPAVKGDYVFSLEQAPSGNLLVGTKDKVLSLQHSGGKWVTSPIITSKENRITGIRKSSSGGYWVSGTEGLQLIKLGKDDRLLKQEKFEFEEKKHVSGRIRLCREDSRQNLWVLSDGRLFCLKKGEHVIREIRQSGLVFPRRVTALLVDKFGIIWLGSANEGVFRYGTREDGSLYNLDRVGADDREPNLGAKTILTLYESREAGDDDVWIGTAEAGVFQFSRSKNNYLHWHGLLKNEPAFSRSFFALYAASDGDLWAGTLEGLLRFDKTAKSYRKFVADPLRPEKNVYQAILEDSKGRLWIGSNAGLFNFDKQKEKFTPVKIPQVNGHSPVVMKIYEDFYRNIWVGTSEYLLKIGSDAAFEVFQYAFVDGKKMKMGAVGDIVQEGPGVYWLGTNHGLMRFDGSEVKEAFTYRPDTPEGLMENMILDVFLSSSGDLWIASAKGLSKLIREKDRIRFKHLTEKDGLPNSFVYGILEDDSRNLWFSTNKGVGVLNPMTGAVRNYQGNDGLGGNEFNSGAFARSRTGELFFGGLNLLVSFDPAKFTENHHVPRLAVSSLSIGEEDVNADSIVLSGLPVKIPYDRNNLRLQLSSLDFTNPAKNEYAYRIKGIHNSWVKNGNQRQLSFFDLPYGKYNIELISSNNNGLWNDDRLTRIAIHVIPPFWRTYWFYGVVALLISALIYAFYRNRLQSKLRFLLAMETVRLEENERVRKIASQDMHDEFGNSLTRISILTELIRNKIAQNKDKEALSLLTKIADNSNRLYQGTKDFIWSINAENDSLFEVGIRIKDFCEEVLDNSGISFTSKGISEEMRLIQLNPGASRHVVMIFKEAVMNTLKHSGAGQVALTFDVGEHEAVITWEDNGKGFEGCENKGLGLTNMKNRADRIGSILEISSSAGTRVTLRTPQKQRTINRQNT